MALKRIMRRSQIKQTSETFNKKNKVMNGAVKRIKLLGMSLIIITILAGLNGCTNYLLVPTVHTLPVTEIGPDYAVSGGNVTDDGGYPVTAKGVYWNTEPYPPEYGNQTVDGTGLGEYTSTIYGLINNTQYYVIAYATNANGTGHGDPVPFTTAYQTLYGLPCPNVPSLIYGGKTYNTVLIGTQCWMKENLDIGSMITGGQNQADNGIIEKYCYDDQPANCTIYGGLYQWDEAMQYPKTAGNQGICPPGWHIPSHAEWNILADFLGGFEEAGGKIKEDGTAHWKEENVGASNLSGFTALPGGFRHLIGYFGYLTEHGYFWTSTNYDQENDWLRFVSHFNRNLQPYEYGRKKMAYSIRCIMN
jgi:uncharacterized protein (TIGR02145 family)